MGPHPFRRGKSLSAATLIQRNAPYRVIRTQNHGLATAIYSIVNVRARLSQGILRAVPS